MRLSINRYLKGLCPLLATLSPLSPSPYQGEGEELEREAKPLFNSPETDKERLRGIYATL